AKRPPLLLGVHRERLDVGLDLPASLGGLRARQPPQPRALRQFVNALDPQLPVLTQPEVDEQEPEERVEHAEREQAPPREPDVPRPRRWLTQRVDERERLVEEENAEHAGHAEQKREDERSAEPPEPAEAGRIGSQQQLRLGDVALRLLLVEEPEFGHVLGRE